MSEYSPNTGYVNYLFDDGELNEDSVVRLFRTTAADWKQYEVAHYNLDMVLALGFRVRSSVGVRFRFLGLCAQFLMENNHD